MYELEFWIMSNFATSGPNQMLAATISLHASIHFYPYLCSFFSAFYDNFRYYQVHHRRYHPRHYYHKQIVDIVSSTDPVNRITCIIGISKNSYLISLEK